MCVSSCADYTDYPDDGEYLSEYPYFFYRIDRSSGGTAEIDYNGKRINVGMTGSSFHINDKADVKKDEDGEPYLNAEDIIIRPGAQTKRGILFWKSTTAAESY